MKTKAVSKLEKELNKEYQYIGKINIDAAHEDRLKVKDIDYVKSIMSETKPLDIKKPIIVDNNYTLIDGYHRLKNHLEKKIENIDVIVLDRYKITKKPDTFYDFMEGIKGQAICFLDDYIFKLNNKIYVIEPNEGCGGCNNGWSSLEIQTEFIDKKIKVNNVSMDNEDEDSDEYDLYINNKLFAKVDTGWGNGYYGGDFVIRR